MLENELDAGARLPGLMAWRKIVADDAVDDKGPLLLSVRLHWIV